MLYCTFGAALNHQQPNPKNRKWLQIKKASEKSGFNMDKFISDEYICGKAKMMKDRGIRESGMSPVGT
jgi:hypothetical protein